MLPVADLPPALVEGDVELQCVVEAGEHYKVPWDVMLAVLKIEGGRAGTVSGNTDGTRDYGPWQINSHWLDELAPHGLDAKALTWDGCAGAWTASWVMRQCLNRHDDFWRGVGCYHSGTQAPYDRNAAYAHKVYRAWQTLRRSLSTLKGAPEETSTP